MGKVGTITRRTLLIGTATIGAGVAFVAWRANQPLENPFVGNLSDGDNALNPFVLIAEDGTVTIVVPRAEMGQGVMTTLAALVAEELDLDLSEIAVIHGPASETYYNSAMITSALPVEPWKESMVSDGFRQIAEVASKMLGMQLTGGSTSTRDAFDRMRIAGACARETLKATAAEVWNVDRSTLETDGGAVIDRSGPRSVRYAELAAAAALREPITDVQPRDPSEWKLLGRSQQRVDVPSKVKGSPIFGIDMSFPDMLHGTVAMGPMPGSKPRDADRNAALAIQGVRAVVPISSVYGEGYGIIADSTWTAFKARRALAPEWENEEPFGASELDAAFQAAFDEGGGDVHRNDGDIDRVFADLGDEDVLSAEYSVPALAHATMEPMNATARFKDGVLDIWCGNQSPTLVRKSCAEALEIDEADCRVHTTMLGGGFGRRAEFDFALYASLMAARTDGLPVKVTWCREEDTRHDLYRPPAKAKCRARLTDTGGLEAIDMQLASPSVMASLMNRMGFSSFGPDATMSEGAANQLYKPKNFRVSTPELDIPLPVGFWRSVGNSNNAFIMECFLDEVAHAAGRDPLELRLELLADFEPAKAVLRTVAEMANWQGGKSGENSAQGLAFCFSFNTSVAQIVEVSRGQDDRIAIDKVWCAADCGLVLDPAIVRAQLSGGIVFGLSAAMMQEITLKDGAVEQGNFDSYPMMRYHQCPEIKVALSRRQTFMGGIGEPGVPPAAPALANAVAALTGERIRTLPLNKSVLFA
ncbi:xanthine dehydrogenase family protein molybdopterin-binding subunit [Notoacmeibacter ruber]|uniref:Xanthine dehydrogenase family protein molybdopterin-binding subunit n=1 Tax=Notoacmeibacter ruber TaxID=2670375 RepID=A0A3L7JEL0_9HYPH|nr:molybdopterin cofactor-binding domain-containing protein [Notoacmeibacter ruber]RLQ88755.1 xanthine dehydrogenase family protein molybdopterin-binding subunit [Notoacmeibacter ruber]